MILKSKIQSDSFYLIRSDNHQTVFALKPKEWETNFFKKRVGSLNINTKQLGDISISGVGRYLKSLLVYSDEKRYNLIEIALDLEGMAIIPILEDKRFRLVDTRLIFITLMRKREIVEHVPKIGKICLATRDMKENILKLTHKSFTYNPSFFSRFKNKIYYTLEETKRYYSAWIESHLEDKETLFAVIKDEDKIFGYLIYKYSGTYQDKSMYKGVLVAVDRDYRSHNAHLALQSFVYQKLPGDEFYLDTTTQLTNLATIKNYIKTKKDLVRVEYIFYRSLPD